MRYLVAQEDAILSKCHIFNYVTFWPQMLYYQGLQENLLVQYTEVYNSVPGIWHYIPQVLVSRRRIKLKKNPLQNLSLYIELRMEQNFLDRRVVPNL